MAGVAFKVDADLGEEIEQAFAQVRRACAGQMRPLMAEIGFALADSTRHRIKTTKRAPDGTPWPDISPAWRKRKAEQGFAEGILTMRGDLLNSIQPEPADAHVDIVAGPTEYAGIQHFGGMAGRNRSTKIPARTYMGLSAEDRDEILDATSDYLERLVTKP